VHILPLRVIHRRNEQFGISGAVERLSTPHDLPALPGKRLARAYVDWQFITSDARTKLKRLYPAFES